MIDIIDEKIFRITTKNTEYQMKVDENRVLRHIWYGTTTGADMEYLQEYPCIGFSGNIYDVGDKREYSLDTMPLEYSTEGVGDFRLPSISIINADGSNALDLRYEGYDKKSGKSSIPGLPAVYSTTKEGETLEIYLKDDKSNVEVTLKYGVIEELDVITRSVVIKNSGKDAVKIEKAASMCLDIPYGEWDWVHFYGRHVMERITERTPIIHGIQESSSKRGTSSHQQNPTALICSKDCNETSGECYGIALMYSGCWSCKIEKDQINQTRVVMGINPEMFSWKLEVGEEFYTPEVIMSYSNSGTEKLSHNFHEVIRENVCRGKFKLSERSILINNWEATYFNFDEEKIQHIAETASKLGIEMLVLDDGWFGERNNDNKSLGDWTVNENKLKNGLNGLVEKVKSYGMKFGIWMEPEMISEDSKLYREHPDWAIKIPGRNPVRSRYQLVLDITRKEVRDYIFDSISNILNSADISYMKLDMNRSICDWYSKELPADRMGEMPHRYVLALYDLLERITEKFPNVLFEGCSGGGARFDAGMLYYFPQIWCSDNTDAYDRTIIQYGTSFFYPASTMGTHISITPNHQTGRITPIESRATVAMPGSFGYELDVNALTDEEKRKVKEQIKEFKKLGNFMHNAQYYRLSNPLTDKYAVWAFSSKDKSEVIVQGLIFKTEANMIRYKIKLRGFDPEKSYIEETSGIKYSGKALLEGGILLPAPWGDYFPVNLHFKEVKKS